MPKNPHKRLLEAVNHGCYWVDCSCGWSGGAHRTRAIAAEAHAAHVRGDTRVQPIPPTINIAPEIAYVDISIDAEHFLQGLGRKGGHHA